MIVECLEGCVFGFWWGVAIGALAMIVAMLAVAHVEKRWK
jgi:uncharacterized membrane protein YdjX (TVP38/TMEM64 family)